MSFTIAIIGRPNVGKSTLFNRLVGRQFALVDDLPGVTRDRREGDGHIADLGFRLIDTAGLEESPPATLAGRMRAQTERSLDIADVALLVIDAREGVTQADRHFARWLRPAGRPGAVVRVATREAVGGRAWAGGRGGRGCAACSGGGRACTEVAPCSSQFGRHRGEAGPGHAAGAGRGRGACASAPALPDRTIHRVL